MRFNDDAKDQRLQRWRWERVGMYYWADEGVIRHTETCGYVVAKEHDAYVQSAMTEIEILTKFRDAAIAMYPSLANDLEAIKKGTRSDVGKDMGSKP